MATTFKFKSYVPPSRKPAKPLPSESAAKRQDTVVPAPAPCKPSTCEVHGLFRIHDAQVMASVDSTNLHSSENEPIILKTTGDQTTGFGRGGSTYNENTSSLAPHTTEIAGGLSTSQGNRQDEGPAVPTADDEDDWISTSQIDPNHQKLVHDHSDAGRLAAAEHEDDPAVRGVADIPSESSGDSLASPCSAPLADSSTNSPGTEAYCRTSADDENERFQDWLNWGRAQGTESSSKETRQLLSEDGNASDTDHEQPAKRQRLCPAESQGALLKMSCDQEIHTKLFGKSVLSDETCLSESCHFCDQGSANSDEGQIATEATALRAKPGIHLQAASPTGVISPPASMPFNVASASEKADNAAVEQVQLARPSRNFAPPIHAEACRSRSVTETSVEKQTDSCSSCVIFRVALLEALSLLECQSPVGDRNQAWRDNLVQNALQRRTSKRIISGQCKSIATVDPLPHADTTGGDSSGKVAGQFKKENTQRRNKRRSRSIRARYSREDTWGVDREGFTDLTDDDSLASNSSVEVAGRGLLSYHPVSEDHTPKQQGQLSTANPQRRERRHSRSQAAPSQHNGTRNVNRPRQSDADYDKSIRGACFEGEDNGSDFSSARDPSSDLGNRRRRWTELEVRRLRAWKRESKSESWIAARLNRTESAVKQQWRKMTE